MLCSIFTDANALREAILLRLNTVTTPSTPVVPVVPKSKESDESPLEIIPSTEKKFFDDIEVADEPMMNPTTQCTGTTAELLDEKDRQLENTEQSTTNNQCNNPHDPVAVMTADVDTVHKRAMEARRQWEQRQKEEIVEVVDLATAKQMTLEQLSQVELDNEAKIYYRQMQARDRKHRIIEHPTIVKDCTVEFNNFDNSERRAVAVKFQRAYKHLKGIYKFDDIMEKAFNRFITTTQLFSDGMLKADESEYEDKVARIIRYDDFIKDLYKYANDGIAITRIGRLFLITDDLLDCHAMEIKDFSETIFKLDPSLATVLEKTENIMKEVSIPPKL